MIHIPSQKCPGLFFCRGVSSFFSPLSSRAPFCALSFSTLRSIVRVSIRWRGLTHFMLFFFFLLLDGIAYRHERQGSACEARAHARCFSDTFLVLQRLFFTRFFFVVSTFFPAYSSLQLSFQVWPRREPIVFRSVSFVFMLHFGRFFAFCFFSACASERLPRLLSFFFFFAMFPFSQPRPPACFGGRAAKLLFTRSSVFYCFFLLFSVVLALLLPPCLRFTG